MASEVPRAPGPDPLPRTVGAGRGATRTRGWLALLLLASSGVALLLGELLVRVLAPQQLLGPAYIASSRGYGRHRPSATVRHRFPSQGIDVRYTFDARGLRVVGPPPSADALRVLLLGDSFAFGWLLADPDTLAARLDALAAAPPGPGAPPLSTRRIRFLDGATGGWGTAQILAFVEESIDSIAPHAVLVVVNVEDAGRSADSALFSLRPDGSLEAGTPLPPTGRFRGWLGRSPAWAFLAERSHALALVRRRLAHWHRDTRAVRFGGRPPGPDEPFMAPRRVARREAARRLTEAIFLRLRDACAARHTPLLVTTTGFEGFMLRGDPAWSHPRTAGFLRSAPAFFAGAGIPYLPIGDRFVAELGGRSEPCLIPDDVHPTAAAVERMARLQWEAVGPALRASLTAAPRLDLHSAPPESP
jgi:lysophospholipase L1-like esterase